MIKNYLLIAFRNLSKNKAFSFINITGLAIGMAACLLIMQYVVFELSYDAFHTKKDRVYRIQQDRYNNGQLSTQWAAGAFAAASEFKSNFPEIEDFVKIIVDNPKLLDYGDKKLTVQKVYIAGKSFFTLFSYPLINGDAKTALSEPGTVVLSATTAKNLFGSTDIVGKTVKLNSEPFKVTAVFKDMPENTHLKADLIMSYATLFKDNPVVNGENFDNQWGSDGCLSYVLLKPGINPKALEAKFVPYVNKIYKDRGSNEGAVYKLQPVKSIHLYSHYMMEAEPNGDGKSVYLLLGIAIFVIVIAWINYINLATAKGISRAKEVGVRKTLGSSKGQLFAQFMLEAALLNGLSVLLGIVMIIIFLPVFAAVSGRAMNFSLLLDPAFWLVAVGLFITGSFFSGFYPAFVLSEFKPVTIMKGRMSASPKGVFLRKAMVVFQFATSIFLLIGSLTVFRQIQYMQRQKLGVNIDQTLVIKRPLVKVDSIELSMSSFKQESLRNSNIRSITRSTNVPGEAVGWNAGGIKLVGADESGVHQYRVIGVDEDYMQAYGLKFLAGRKFSKEFSTDPQTVIYNKSALPQISITDPEKAIGKRIDFWGQVYTIIGVVDDFHQQSLRDAYEPLIFRYIPDLNTKISVKVSANNLPQTIAFLKKNWETFFPRRPVRILFSRPAF
jgi:putative ABC transport system permease protein